MKAYTALAVLLALTMGQSMSIYAADDEEAEAPIEETEATTEDAADDDATISGSITPFARMYWVDGNESHFREVMWMDDEFDGGVKLKLKSPTDSDIVYDVDAKASIGWEDFDVEVNIAHPGSGFFIRGGFEQFHKYYGDQGGYYLPNDPSTLRQDKDLEMDIGSYWVEAGWMDPDGTLGIMLGYRGSYKDGEKSTTEFYNDGTNHYIAPGYKDIDEQTHTVYLELQATVAEIKLLNRTTYETWDTDTKQVVVFDGEGRSREEDSEYDRFSNALTFERWIAEKVLVSGGYLYNETDGEGLTDLMYIPYPVGSSRRYLTDYVDFDSRSHVGNLNAMFGPFKDLTLVLGFQAEYTELDADALVLDLRATGGVPPLDPGEHDLTTSTEMYKFRETVELAYAGIPHTKVYVRGEWEQAEYDLNELELEDGIQALYRQTDTDRDRQTYRVGFTTRVLAPVSIGAYYQKKFIDNDYDHNIDEEEEGVPLDGYSAFLEELDFETDELSVRISSPVTNWLTLGARYLYVGTEIDNQVDASAPVPNASGTANDYDSHTISANAVFSPSDRLYFTVGGSYRYTRSTSPVIDADALTRYYSETLSVNASVNYALSPETTIYGTAYYANSDSDEDKTTAARLPVGVDYDAQTYTLGVKHRFRENMTGKLEGLYAIYDDENYDDDAGDFEAVGVHASLTWEF